MFSIYFPNQIVFRISFNHFVLHNVYNISRLISTHSENITGVIVIYRIISTALNAGSVADCVGSQ